MSEAQPSGLLTRAKRLTSLARQAREGAEAVQDHARTETALVKLADSLSELEVAVKLQSRLVSLGVTSETKFDLTKAPKDLRRHLSTVGRPSPQLLTARAADAAKAAHTISESTAAAWRTWAEGRLDALPIDRVARLGNGRISTDAKIKRLEFLAYSLPTDTTVDDFLSVYEAVASQLAKVAPDAPIDSLLAKLPCHLDELTDDELTLLREKHADIAAQIELRIE